MQGLTHKEAQERLKTYGTNEIVPSTLTGVWTQFLHVLGDPMGMMLLILAALYFLLGKPDDAVVLLVCLLPIWAVDVILKMRSQNALKALKKTISTTSKVIREGAVCEVSVKSIVPGDILVFEPGQQIVADGKILQANFLNIDESALTGESLPIEKNLADLVFAGTNILDGAGLAEVTATGRKTQFGKIALLLEETQNTVGPLQNTINNLVKKVFWLALILALGLFILEYLKTKMWVDALMVSLTFAMSAIPEEFPLVFTLYLSMGAWRLSKHKILVKNLPSVETLGRVDVICTDKTGTLTEGIFQLEELIPVGREKNLNELWRAAIFACEEHAIDTMDLAIIKVATPFLNLKDGWQLIWDHPFEKQGKHMSHVWKNCSSGEEVIAMKGAVEGVLEHCLVSDDEAAQIKLLVQKYAGQGKRLLGLASLRSHFNGDRFLDEQNLNFLGLLIFSDPIRASVKEAIRTCEDAKIEIKMITGDHPFTAHAVADEIEIAHMHDDLFTGDELTRMSEAQREKAYLKGVIFSRVVPEQKHQLVQVLKNHKKVVAMTGDGINDAPALKLADIGISMGKNATDIARSSAQMILMENNFNGIVTAIFEGRNIFYNLKRSFSYLISFHIPVVLLSLIPALLGRSMLLLPIHIILLELVVHPISAFTFENLPIPQNAKGEENLMSKTNFLQAALSGVLLTAFSLWLPAELSLVTLILGNIFFVLTETWPNVTKRFYLTTFFILALTSLFCFPNIFINFLHLTPVSVHDLPTIFIVAALSSLPTFIWKKFDN